MSREFDADVWRAQRGSNALDNPRVGQVVALERSHMRPGMSRAEVIELLGEPDRRLPRSDHYKLGASPVGVDFETYVIEYDDHDRVTSFGIRRS
jgi:hypothetical protein